MEKAKLHSSIVNLAFSMKERFTKGDNGRLKEGEVRKGLSVQDRWKRPSYIRLLLTWPFP